MSKGQFIIENKLPNDKWYISECTGDPGRTLKKENAKRYLTQSGAKRAITYYLSRYSFRKMKLVVTNTMDTKYD